MFWIILLAMTSTSGHEHKLLVGPPAVFTSEERCNDALEYLTTETDGKLQCAELHIVAAGPAENF